MNTNQIQEDIRKFTEENSERMFADIARLIRYNTVLAEPEEGAPYGIETRKVLEEAMQLSSELGLEAVNCENKIGYAQLGEGGKDCSNYLATITHLDVVPAGTGWKHQPFEMEEEGGYIFGRGVMDDKGPTVLCLYALKYLKDRKIPLKYPVRAILGLDEETGMKDVEYYLENYPAPLFCFSPDADFPMCNGEKGIYRGNLISKCAPDKIRCIVGGEAVNAVPPIAEAWVVTDQALTGTASVDAEPAEDGLWHLTAHGIGGHASMPQGTVNAIGVLVDYILENHLASEEEEAYFKTVALLNRSTDGSSVGADACDEAFGPLTLIGGMIRIRDGKFVQSLDSRYPTTTSGAKIAESIQKTIGDAAIVTLERDTVPFFMSTDKPEVQACLDAYREITGEDAEPYTIGGGTYARHFPNAVSFGPEHPEREQPDFVGPIHGADEGASKAYMLEALQVYILALLKLEELEF